MELRIKTFNWSQINWGRAERRVRKLQMKIYILSKQGDLKAVHAYQTILLECDSAKLVAIRKVTQDNRGKKKKTPGVDGVRSISAKERVILAHNH